jgi:hypothetical protein
MITEHGRELCVALIEQAKEISDRAPTSLRQEVFLSIWHRLLKQIFPDPPDPPGTGESEE